MLSKMKAKVKINKVLAFSLVEVSVIIMIAGLLISGYVTWIVPAAKSNAFKFVETQQRIETINDAIEKFVSLNGRLPCPADSTTPYGALSSGDILFSSENLSGSTCTNNVGAVPTSVLGLSPDTMLDSWGRKFTYVTSNDLCGTSGCTPSNYNNEAALLLNLRGLPLPGADITTKAAYLIISHGPAGRGAFRQSGTQQSGCTTEEAENCDIITNNVFRSGTITSDFQHLVFYRNKTDLDNLVVDPNTKLTDIQTCLNNSIQLAAITRSIAVTNVDSLRNTITNTAISLTRSNANGDNRTQIYNTGDEAALDVLWHLQEACYLMYPSQMPAVKACPGGGTYNASENACICNNGTWNGSC